MRKEFAAISKNADDRLSWANLRIFLNNDFLNLNCRDPEIDVDFEACRGCLTPVTEGQMDSAIVKSGKFSRMLKLMTGIDVSLIAQKLLQIDRELFLQLTKDNKIHSVLICNPCSKTLQHAVHIRFIINQNKKQYFEKIESLKVQCLKCAKTFSNAHNLRRHANTSTCAKSSSPKEPTSTKENVRKSNVNLKRRMSNSDSQTSEPNSSVQICKVESSGTKAFDYPSALMTQFSS